MNASPSPSTTLSQSSGASGLRSPLTGLLLVLAIVYAFFAGLRTVGDPDIGWQIATGRWIVQHHSIPYHEVLSYTATGREWIYPALSQIIFYLLYKVAGFSMLSWFAACACVFIILLLVRENAVTTAFAVLLVPLVAERTAPRAEVFTEVFFALYVTILWRYHRKGHGPLWLLPVIMLLWVNTHLGFAAGLGVCGAFVLFELEDGLYPDRRSTAVSHLRHSAPWLIAALGVTILNPWSARNYVGMYRLLPVQSSRWIVELGTLKLNASTWLQAFDIRDPRSTVYIMILLAAVSVIAAVRQKRFTVALTLTASIYLVIHSIRFVALFGIVVTVFGGSILAGTLRERRMAHTSPRSRIYQLRFAVVAILGILVAVRISDLVTNRFYLRTPYQFGVFGPGESWWFPEEAARFVKQNHLPPNIFHDFNTGGFVAMQLGPDYPDYVDGRGAPFGEETFFRALELSSTPMDSAEWRKEASLRDIKTALLDLDPFLGSGLQALSQNCASESWKPVFLDAKAAIFVRVEPENQDLIRRFQIDCSSVQFDHPPDSTGRRGAAERFYYFRNAAAILISLGRQDEALSLLSKAEQASPDNPALHYLRGIAYQFKADYSAAELELRRAVALDHTERNLRALANVYRRQARYGNAAATLREAVEVAPNPNDAYLELGFVDLAMELPQQALQDFAAAEESSPFPPGQVGTGSEFYRYLDKGRIDAWLALADWYEAHGNHPEASNARQQAQMLIEEQVKKR